MMAEYIDRQIAVETINDHMHNVKSCNPYYNLARCHMRQLIELLPAADVVERKKGKWIKGVGENGVTTSLFCSVCHYENTHWREWNFCPNCGAEMVGE